jgi:lipopolysaccharide/colanic/teichoic acid biosynthesis glycosyltransferase
MGGRCDVGEPGAGKVQRRLFTVFKFRTMRNPQVTCVGRWLRQAGLDELPQFINVCRGDVSVIGPPATHR